MWLSGFCKLFLEGPHQMCSVRVGLATLSHAWLPVASQGPHKDTAVSHKVLGREWAEGSEG